MLFISQIKSDVEASKIVIDQASIKRLGRIVDNGSAESLLRLSRELDLSRGVSLTSVVLASLEV